MNTAQLTNSAKGMHTASLLAGAMRIREVWWDTMKQGRLKMYKALGMILFAALFSNGAYAFQFEFLLIKDPVHQNMSERALKCVILHENENEINCETLVVSEASKSISIDVNGMEELTVSDIREAVIWADDPVREVRLRKPHKVALWLFRLLENKCEDLKGGLKDGLRCSTHYGNLQFMHSMESKKGISADKTQKAILDWIEYSYSVALNESEGEKYFNDIDYCEYFEKNIEDGLFKDSMLPVDEEGNKLFPCNEIDDTPWQLGTLFSFSCWFGSAVCSEYSFGNNFLTRKAALGAVLHAVQDSYAKGHVSRGNDVKEHLNVYECAPIVQFQEYGAQNHDKHTEADTIPEVSPSCSDKNNDIHGPVTASAEIIRLFIQKEKPNKIREYLQSHVFKLADTTLPSGSTKLFEK